MPFDFTGTLNSVTIEITDDFARASISNVAMRLVDRVGMPIGMERR